MARGVFDPNLSDLPRVVPIFPLAGALLLPGGRLPLNVFEPRYLAMVQDALAAQRVIGMIQPREEVSDAGAADTYRTGCAGRISSFAETEDGRYLITLTGLIRFDIERELPATSGYRRVIADYARFHHDLEVDHSEVDRRRLLETLNTYLDAEGIEGDWSAIEETADEPLITSLAMICPFGPPEKQALLEAMTLDERADTMATIMEMAVHADDSGRPRHH